MSTRAGDASFSVQRGISHGTDINRKIYLIVTKYST